MTERRSEKEESILESIRDTEGIKKIVDPVTIQSIVEAIDVLNRWNRQLGQIDLQRVLGSAISVTNPVLSSIVYGGTIIDSRSIRALTSSDVITVEQSDALKLKSITQNYSLSLNAIVNGIFEHESPAGKPLGWIYSGDVEVVTDHPYQGNKCVRLGLGSSIYQVFSPPIRTDDLTSKRFFMWVTIVGEQVDYYRLYSDGTSATGTLGTGAFFQTWRANDMVINATKNLLMLKFSPNGANTSDIFIDLISIDTVKMVDLFNNYNRQLGTIKQFDKDRTISRIDDTIFTEGYGSNGDFETNDLRGWKLIGDSSEVYVIDTVAHTGEYSLYLSKSANALWQFYYPPIPVDALSCLSMMLYRLLGTFRYTVYYSDGTNQVSTSTPALLTWTSFTPSTTSGKYIIAIRMSVSGTNDIYCVDAHRILWGVPVTYDRMKKLLDWAYRYTFYADPEALANNTDKYFLDSDVPTPAECIPPLKLARCLLGSDTKEVVIYVGYDDYWHGGFRADWEVTFETLHAMGGEDHMLKELRYDEVNSLFEVMLKCPLVMMEYAWIGLGNYTGGAVNIWSEGEFFVL